LSSEPEEVKSVTGVRRRRSSRHRRSRRVRQFVLATFCALLTVGFATEALRRFSPSLFSYVHLQRADPAQPGVTPSESLLLLAEQEAFQAQKETRPVYPYSVVSGGVRDVRELRSAVEHDRVVAAHYAGFNYARARLIQLMVARSAFVSYRVGNKVYWTRRRVKLKKGEYLLTDGKMTARTRCANRVEEAPQQAAAKNEPPAAMFEEPVRPSLGTAVENPPVPFESALLNRPGMPGLGPAPPLSLYDPIGGGTWTPIAPPPLPSLCGIGTKKPKDGAGVTGTLELSGGKKKKNPDPCGNGGGGGETPEPQTWVLVASGLSAIYWKARKKFARS